MKVFLAFLLAAFSLSASAQSPTLTPGTAAPAFTLKNVDGKPVSFKNYPAAKGFIVVFTCNTCPYAKAYEQRVLELNAQYAPLGYPVMAINTNDPEASPGDSYAKMKERAKSKGYTFPYLYDAGQVVTKAYGATKTPHIFLVSRTGNGFVIEYTGAIDNDSENANPNKTKYVEQAIAALRNNTKPPVTVTKAVGCTIKWKGGGGSWISSLFD